MHHALSGLNIALVAFDIYLINEAIYNHASKVEGGILEHLQLEAKEDLVEGELHISFGHPFQVSAC